MQTKQCWHHFVQVYVRLSEKLGLRDHLTVLTVILSKIGTNLKVFGSAEDVIQDTLTLFSVRFSAVSDVDPAQQRKLQSACWSEHAAQTPAMGAHDQNPAADVVMSW